MPSSVLPPIPFMAHRTCDCIVTINSTAFVGPQDGTMPLHQAYEQLSTHNAFRRLDHTCSSLANFVTPSSVASHDTLHAMSQSYTPTMPPKSIRGTTAAELYPLLVSPGVTAFSSCAKNPFDIGAEDINVSRKRLFGP